MSQKMNKRDKRRFDDDVMGEFDRKHRRNDDDVEDKLDDIIKLLKKILRELDEIEDEDDNKRHNKRHHKNCCDRDDIGGEEEENEHCKRNRKHNRCDVAIITFNARTHNIVEATTSDTNNNGFGCNLDEGEPAAPAIACLLNKGFKIVGTTATEGNVVVILQRCC